MTAPIKRPSLRYLPLVRMSGNSPRWLAVGLVERQAGCFAHWNIQAGSQMTIGTVQTESGLTGVPQSHGLAYLAVLIVQVHAGSAVRCEVNSYSGAAIGIRKIQPDCAVGQNAHRATQLAAAVAQQELLRFHGIGHRARLRHREQRTA